MVAQFKFIRVYEQNILIELSNLFGKENIEIIDDSNVVAIKFDYEKNTYSQVMKKIYNMDLSQYIITSNKFINIIKFAIMDNRIILDKIKFIDFIEDEIENKINTIIFDIKREKSKNLKMFLMKVLLEHLDWIMLDECIDIQSVSFTFKIDEYPFHVNTSIYNNGVMFIDTDHLENIVEEIILAMDQGDTNYGKEITF